MQFIVFHAVRQNEQWGLHIVQRPPVARGDREVEFAFHRRLPGDRLNSPIPQEFLGPLAEGAGPGAGEDGLHPGIARPQAEHVEQPGRRGHRVHHHENRAHLRNRSPRTPFLAHQYFGPRQRPHDRHPNRRRSPTSPVDVRAAPHRAAKMQREPGCSPAADGYGDDAAKRPDIVLWSRNELTALLNRRPWIARECKLAR